MNPYPSCRRFASGMLALVLLAGASRALAGSTLIGTTDFASNGTSSHQSYTVPSGANYVTIQAWGAQGYVEGSYCASPGQSFSIQFSSSNGGETMVQGPNGTVQIAGGSGTCTASGSVFNMTTVANWTTSGPASPGAGNKYAGYVIIQAAYGTYTLTISASPSAAGTVTGGGTYAVGTNVQITGSAWNGYRLAGWGGADGPAVTSSGSNYDIMMTQNRTVVADFSPLVPVFTSSDAAQTLVVGKAYSFQVTATESPVFTATSLPPGLSISSSGLISGTPSATGVGVWSSVITAANDAVSVQEQGVGANEIVNISSSTLGNNLEVYAGELSIGVNGDSTFGFCIDPWHSSQEDTWLDYDWESLSSGPKTADGMGSQTATEIGQLWDEYYSANISNSISAGLQIAIWDLVTASISAQTNGLDWYTYNSANDYGASSMLAWLQANPDAPTANLYAVTGNGQDYVVQASALPQPVQAAASATQTIPLFVYATPAVASATVTIPLNQPYGYYISATGSPTGYSASNLPSGFSVNTGTGFISGTPTAAGTYVVTLGASNPGASGSGTLTLNVVPTYTLAISVSPGVSAGSATGAGTYMAGTTVQIQETAASGWAATGWSGPSASDVASAGSATTTITMNGNYSLVAGFNPLTPSLTGALPAVMLVGQSVTVPVSATPASTISVSNLPPGLTWNGSNSIGSAPTTVGAYTATISANNNGATASKNTSTTVYPQLSVPSGSTSTPENQPFSYLVCAPAWGSSLSASGLPAGLTFNAASGTISGTPTATGTFTIALGETNPATSASGTLTLTVTPMYTLTIGSATGGTAIGAGTYAPGTTVTVAETPSSSYRTNGWGGPDAGELANAASGSTTIVMNGNYTIDPQFVQQATLTIAGANGGTATGGGTFDVGSVQPIVATANTNYAFASWSGAGIASSNSASTTITITGDETITPSFLAEPSATLNAPANAYTGSPLTVTSSAYAPSDNLTLHSIEWLSPDGTWSVSVTQASGTEDDRTLGITFPSTGLWTARAGASTDNGNTWYYSPNQSIDVVSGFTDYTFETMAVPAANMTNWYNTSPVAEKTYTVQHVNP